VGHSLAPAESAKSRGLYISMDFLMLPLLSYKRKMQFPVLIYQDEDGVFIGEVPTCKGVHTHGKTLKELHTNLQEVVRSYMEMHKTPPSEVRYSFQILTLDEQVKNSPRKNTYQVA
jgi:predicted RNase H-like HicB family nuclease